MKTSITFISFIIIFLLYSSQLNSNRANQTNLDFTKDKIIRLDKSFVIPTYNVNDRQEDCKKIEEKVRNQEIILKAYQDMQLLEYADKNGLDYEEYDKAVDELAKWIKSGKPYEPNKLSSEQVENFFNSTTPSGDGSTTTLVMITIPEDGSIWAPDGTIGSDGYPVMAMIIDAHGNKTIEYSGIEQMYGNKYGNTVGKTFFESGIAHEKVHSEQFKNEGVNNSPGQHRRFEMAAYEKGIEVLKRKLEELECDKVRGSIDYNHNIKFNYGAFSQTVTITGSVPFKLEESAEGTQGKQKVKGKGTVNLSLIWTAEDCIGRSDSPGEIEFEGEIISENEEKFIDIKFDEKWYQNAVLTVTCPEVTKNIPMTIPPPVKYENMKFKFKDGEKITRPFAGMGGTGTYSWTIRLPDSEE